MEQELMELALATSTLLAMPAETDLVAFGAPTLKLVRTKEDPTVKFLTPVATPTARN
jgi:hypothetical protein